MQRFFKLPKQIGQNLGSRLVNFVIFVLIVYLKSKSMIVIIRDEKRNRIAHDVDVERIFESVSREIDKVNMADVKHRLFQIRDVSNKL